jgi:hypothetical protein
MPFWHRGMARYEHKKNVSALGQLLRLHFDGKIGDRIVQRLFLH